MNSGLKNTIGGVVRIVVQVVTIPALVRLLGLESYGYWALITATIGTLMVMEAGLSMSTTYFASRAVADGRASELGEVVSIILSLMVAVGTVGAIGLYCSSPWLAEEIIKAPAYRITEITAALRLSAAVLFCRLLQQIPVGVMQALNQYGLYNSLIVFQGITSAVLLLWVASRGGTLAEMMAAEVIVSLAFLVGFSVLAGRLMNGKGARVAWNWSRASSIIRYSLFTWGNSVGALLFANGDRIIVGYVLGPSSAGVYAVVTSLVAKINQLSALPAHPIIPGIRGALSRSLRSAEQLLAFSYRACASIALSMALVIFSFAFWILQVFLNETPSTEAVFALRAGAVIYGLYSVNAPGYYMLLGIGQAGRSLVVVLVCGFIALGLVWLGAEVYGLAGGVVGNSGYILTLLLNTLACSMLGFGAWRWLTWVRWPLGWFGLSAAVNCLSTSFLSNASLILIECACLVLWYMRQEPECIRMLLKRRQK